MPTISSCLILKEITETFPALLEKLWVFSDEIIVVVNDDLDKKSVDFLLKHKCQVISLKWKKDFAEARNVSFNDATKDFIFWCDADDDIDHPEKMKEIVAEMEKNKVDWLVLDYIYAQDEFGNVLARHTKQRVFRRGTVKWEKTVHENSVAIVPIVISDNHEIHIIHKRDMKAEIESSKRNLEILMEEFEKDGEKTDPRTILYIANTLYGLQQYEDAAAFYGKFVIVSGWDEERYLAIHNLSNCLKHLGRLEEAINASLESIKLFPEWSTAFFDLGEFHLNLGEYRKAQEFLELGFNSKRPETQLATSDLEYTVDPIGRYAYALLAQGKINEAKKAVDKLLRVAHPEMPEVKELVERVSAIVREKEYVDAFNTVAHEWKNFSPKKTTVLFDSMPPELASYPHVAALRNELVPPKKWEKDEITIYCPPAYEPWADPSVLSGIGGSEEAVIYLSRELSKLGWKVTVYNTCGLMEGVYNGVTYKNDYAFNPKDRFNVLISWRTPELFTHYDIRAKKKWVWLHDVPVLKYTKEVTDKFDKLIVLSQYHRDLVPEVPDEKIMISSNGIVPEHFPKPTEKLPNTIIYSSSYDRGLECLLKDIMPLVWKEVPEMKLHIAYGWGTFDAIYKTNPAMLQWKEEVNKLMDDPRILHYGRLNHTDLAAVMSICKIHAYPTEFPEINCITVQKTQCAGCTAVTTDFAALHEFNKSGIKIDAPDIYTNKDKQKEFAAKIIQANADAPISERQRLMAIEDFKWANVAKQWSKEASV